MADPVKLPSTVEGWATVAGLLAVILAPIMRLYYRLNRLELCMEQCPVTPETTHSLDLRLARVEENLEWIRSHLENGHR